LTYISQPFSGVALTIAGHDPGSGAGITADLQTFAAHGLFGTSAITALTVQSTLGVAEVRPTPADFLRRSLDYLTVDLPPKGIKIGMTGSVEVIEAINSFIQALPEINSLNFTIPIVIDPVLRSSSGADLTGSESLDALHQLLPHVTWITPNWAELRALTGLPITSLAQAEAAANLLGRLYPSLFIVVTAGDCIPPTDLLRLPSGEFYRFSGEHIETSATHGTGCAFSSALLSRLVLGYGPVEAVQAAKEYVTEAIRRAPRIGHGKGPLNLLWPIA
jgi:hydroxymethylpyrimidine/phosphomethylpyrimidine kinase